MADLVNAKTNQVEAVPQDNVAQALTAGTHNLVKGQPTNVLDPDGNLVSLPGEQVPDALQSGYQIPTQAHVDEYHNQQKYGEGLGNEAKAFGLGVGSGATFGLSNEFLKQSNLVSPEALHEIPERNPVAYGTGQLTGAVGSTLLAPETAPAGLVARAGEGASELATPFAANMARSLANPETSPTVAKILSKVSPAMAKALGSSVEGAAYGLGNAVDEHALGNSDFNAESIMHNVGYGALFNGALGGALGLKGEKALAPGIEQAALKDSIMENAALHPLHPDTNLEDSVQNYTQRRLDFDKLSDEGKDAFIQNQENPGTAFAPGPVPSSLDEVAERVKAAKDMGFTTELPSAARLREADQILAGKTQFPTHGLQYQSLESPILRKQYKVMVESGDPDGMIMRDYEALQKQEGTKIANDTIQQIAPDANLTEDAVKGGDKTLKDFTDAYKTTQKEYAPAFKALDNIQGATITKPQELINILNDAIPKADGLIMKTPGGWELADYKAALPISETTHAALKDLVGALNEPELTLGAIRNVREAIGDRIDWMKGKARSNVELTSLKKGLMDYLQDQAGKYLPDAKLRDTFKGYAINEQNRETMERILGGSISDRASFAKSINKEDVLKRIFSDTESVKAARAILGDEKFNEALANFLTHTKASFTDETKNGFSSNKFGSFLKSKSAELDEAMLHHPDQYETLKANNDRMKILPDSPSANPSGTAQATSILAKMQKLGGFLTPKGLMSIPGEAMSAISEHFEKKAQRASMDKILAGHVDMMSDSQVVKKQAQYTALSKMERMANLVRTKVSSGVRPLLEKTESPLKGIIIQKLTPEDQEKKFDKVSKHIQDMTTSPETMIAHLQDATKDLHDVAPQTNQSLNVALSRATQYLAQKLPQPAQSSPLSEPYKVAPSDIYKFNRTMEAVEKPLSILKHANQGTLTREAVEAVQVTHPEIYKMIQSEVMDQIGKQGVKNIPYQKKLMLSMLTGNDLTNSLSQPNIASAQTPPTPDPQNSPGGKPVRPSQAGLKNLNSSNNLLTASQKSAQRKE